MRHLAAIGISRSNSFKAGRSNGKPRSAQTGFAPVFLVALLALTASALSGCANQNIADDRSPVKSDAAAQSHSNPASPAKASAKSQSAPAAKANAENPPVASPDARKAEPASGTADRAIPA